MQRPSNCPLNNYSLWAILSRHQIEKVKIARLSTMVRASGKCIILHNSEVVALPSPHLSNIAQYILFNACRQKVGVTLLNL